MVKGKYIALLILGFISIFCKPAHGVTERIENDKVFTWVVSPVIIDESRALDEQFTLNSPIKNTHKLNYSFELISPDSISINYEFIRNSTTITNLRFQLELLNASTEVINNKEVHFADIPIMRELNWPQRNLFKNRLMVNAIAEQNEINFYWLNLPSWRIPANPTWQENPYNNISWQMFYVSLGWMTSMGEHYKESNSEQVFMQLEQLLIDFNDTFPSTTTSEFNLIYREDAVSIRTNHLLYIYLNFNQKLSETALSALKNQINNHFEMLIEYINDPQYDDDNHGLIQARSALNLAASFPFNSRENELKRSAITRITKASLAMFSPIHRLSVEQAVDYHFAGISMLLEARAQIEKVGLKVPEVLLETIEQAILTGAYLLYSDGSAPAIGDTYYDGGWRYFIGRYYELLGKENQQLSNFMKIGQRALRDSYLIAEEGLFINKNHTEDSLDKYFFEFGKNRIVHGHFDNLNVLAELDSNKLLIDSGGPYTYSYEGRTNFWAKSAQNNLLINNKNLNDGESRLNYLSESENITAIQAEQLSGSVSHSRTIVYSKHLTHSLLIFDKVEEQAKIEEFWHFPPGTVIINLQNNLNKITLSNGSVFYHYFDEILSSKCRIREGEYDAQGVPLIGWVSPAYNIAEPAPVSYCESFGSGYAKVNLFTTRQLPVNNFKLVNRDGYQVELLDMELIFDSNLGVTFKDEFPNDPNEWRDTDGDGVGNNADLDDDNDGLSDLEEEALGTNPFKADTDGDGISDAEEILKGSDPLNPHEDSDGDGFSNLEEKYYKTNPYDVHDYPINIAPWMKVLYKK